MQVHISATITGLKDEPCGLIITAENGPTVLEFVTNDVNAKQDLRIGMHVRGVLEMADN